MSFLLLTNISILLLLTYSTYFNSAVVQDIRNETASLVGVGEARVQASETGVAGVFGKSRIVPGSGAICISQRQFGDKFQMINPHQDLVATSLSRRSHLWSTSSFMGVLRNAEVISILKISKSCRIAIEMMIKIDSTQVTGPWVSPTKSCKSPLTSC